jgi:hypothetical protein
MKDITAHPKTAALIGLLVVLPFTLILLIAMFEIEPLNGFLKSGLTAGDGMKQAVSGLIFLIFLLLLLPVSVGINLRPIVQSARSGNGVMSNPANLLLAVVISCLFLASVGGCIADQYPCWIGVPNCD